jgi:hypothetical protein
VKEELTPTGATKMATKKENMESPIKALSLEDAVDIVEISKTETIKMVASRSEKEDVEATPEAIEVTGVIAVVETIVATEAGAVVATKMIDLLKPTRMRMIMKKTSSLSKSTNSLLK